MGTAGAGAFNAKADVSKHRVSFSCVLRPHSSQRGCIAVDSVELTSEQGRL